MSNTHALRTAALRATTSKQAVTFSMETTQFPIRATPRATSEQESLMKQDRAAPPAVYPKTPEEFQRLLDGIKELGTEALGQRDGVSKDAVVKLRQRRRKEFSAGVPAPVASSEPQPQPEGLAAAEGGLPHLVECPKPTYDDNKGWLQIKRGLVTKSPEKIGHPLTSTEIARRFRISRNRLIELRHAGVLKPGEHYITHGHRTIWDPAATEQALRGYSRFRCEAQLGETYEEVCQ